jgi:Carboxypeptidase regulatory-like domain
MAKIVSTRRMLVATATAAIVVAAGLIPPGAAEASGGPSTAPAASPTAPGASTTAPGGSGTEPDPQANPHYTPAGCNTPPKHISGRLYAQCLATVWTPNADHRIVPLAAQPPATARTPAEIQDAYNLPATGQGQTVAIVDAYGDSTAEDDLAVFRAQYGLAPCTTANGCFKKVDQDGGTTYPPDNTSPNGGWALETSLDLDAVSAACPACNILLVEGNDNSFDSLGAAEETAVALGAKFVSNSYGASPEDPTELDLDHFYDHPGVVITVSSGDVGNVTNYPSTSPKVVSVGGTTLTKHATVPRGWDESAWADGGSGCSPVEPHPDYQNGIATNCPNNRADADIAADADPATGLATYDSNGAGGWVQVGGTSLASPLVAAMYALAGSPPGGTYPVTYPYRDANQAGDLFDVTSGSNGSCGNVLCQAGPGWDGPTGLGTPNGVDALKLGPHGSITGHVIDEKTGQPIAAATVSTDRGLETSTDANGTYSFDGVPTGSYQVTAGGVYGYQDKTATVEVIADQSVTQDFALAPTPTQTVSGTVTDGSGHGWPLYAEVTSDDGAGHTSSAFTDPATGRYALRLLPGAAYTLHISAGYPGYQAIDKAITLGASDVTEDVGLRIDEVACTAPGYHAADAGLVESFDANHLSNGWHVTNTDLHYPGYTSTPGWVFTNPAERANTTGGTGNFAIVDSDFDGKLHYQDTTLTSPVLNLAHDAGPVLQFATDLQPAVNSTASVDVSTNGGKTWANVWTKTGFPGNAGPATVTMALHQAASKKQVQVRFHYLGSWSQYWEIDNVFVGHRTCTAQAGGLLTGQIDDPNGTGITNATVASVANPDEKAATVPTPDDASLSDGFYWLFTTPTGEQQFTASRTGFTTATGNATITADQVSTLDMTLTPSG